MSNYEYLNTRIRAMYSQLLANEYYRELLSLKEVSLLIDSLLNSPYAVDLSNALATYSGHVAINKALRENLSKNVQKLLSYAEDKAAYWIKLLLSKWDAYNIKTIIRGKLRHQFPEDILYGVVPMANLKDVHLKELAEQEDIGESIDLLTTWGYSLDSRIRKAVIDFYNDQESIHIVEIENLIDRAYYKDLVERLKEKDKNAIFVEQIVRSEIDYLNILTSFKLVYDKSRPKESELFFIRGGYLKESLFESILACQTLEEASSLLEGTEFFSSVEKGVLYFAKSGRLYVMERFLEGVLIKKACSMFRVDPLSISVAIGYLWKKYNEVINLRFIAWGIKYGMPANIIKGELIFV
ncbi:MAG: V-type ATPase subunit [bacterium]|nr:V-type ATPase subunit [bacterium]